MTDISSASSSRRRICVLGATGSIGRQTLDVISRYPDRLQVVGLSAHRSHALLEKQAAQHQSARTLLTADAPPEALPQFIEACQPDIVLNALVGAAGLRATLATLKSGLTLALANKESLVVGGKLVTDAIMRPQQLLPVDSEHSAIFQCLVGEPPASARRLWLTASGGPFRGLKRAQLATVTASNALAHPTWSMGPKITIDSATLMNKGLEVIEAQHLFGVPYAAITVLVQPQSLIHSMVEFSDGSVKAQLGAADMRVPIQYALSYPERWDDKGGERGSRVPDFRTLSPLDFDAADTDAFGCLKLAYQAGEAGGTAPTILNAANEVMVAAFLNNTCSFLDIEALVSEALAYFVSDIEPVETLLQIEALDKQVRNYVTARLAARV